MAVRALGNGIKKFLEQELYRTNRSPLEYVALISLGLLVTAIAKYPDRAIFTRARPDLKGKEAKGLPIVGNLFDFAKYSDNPLLMLYNGFQKYGDVFALTIPGRGRFIFINNPELIEHVLKTNFNNYIKGEIFSVQVRDILGTGIFVSDQEEWRFHRKTAVNIFTTKIYRQFSEDAFPAGADILCSVLAEKEKLGQTVDMQELFMKLTMDVFGKLIFGFEFNSLRTEGPHEFGDAFDYLLGNVDSRIQNPFWQWTDMITPGKCTKIKNALAILDKYAYMAVKKRRNETEEEKEKRPKDLLDQYINHVRDDGTTPTDLELRDVFINFMIAGRDTTALTLSWQFYSLMANPRTLKNVLKELDIVLGGVEDYKFEAMSHGLPYLKAVFHETLRLYTPVPRNVKESLADDVLPDGTIVYKDDIIGFSTWCMGKNKSVWGEDAELFVPERWLNEDEPSTLAPVPGTQGISPFGKFRMESQHKFNSFNSGPRLCIGQTFATLEAMVTSCMLLQRFEFKLVPGQPTPVPKPSAALPMRDPLMMQVKRRS
ncbi:hypothetical protein BG011_001700 [Mortierella polycephala]|uniref:Cytochrome P450 n=1 Tax=Mortierella polycephala TaxID=41804 RepID=A0A9P6Q6Y5_9FUNG|nr:hypothetical protein BG011_001700 [Mortierella polycephala]